MSKFSFEDLHPNHKYAFLDGLLCGALITGYGIVIYKQYKKFKQRQAEAVEFDKLYAETQS